MADMFGKPKHYGATAAPGGEGEGEEDRGEGVDATRSSLGSPSMSRTSKTTSSSSKKGKDFEGEGERGGGGGGGEDVEGKEEKKSSRGGDPRDLVPLQQVIVDTIVHTAKEMKRQDIEEADPRANIDRTDLRQPLIERKDQSDQELAMDVINQEVNTQKVLSTPGIFLYDSPMEMKFVRNTRGDVVRKEYFIYEHYLRDFIKIKETATEHHQCCKIKYACKIEADKGLLATPREMSEELWNWKLFHNSILQALVGLGIIGTIIASYVLKSKYSYFGAVGIIIMVLDLISLMYFRCHGVEKRFNAKSLKLFQTWKAALHRFGELELQQYKRTDCCLVFVEIVERPLGQKKIPGKSQRETDDLEKVGFGQTKYGIKIFAKAIQLQHKHGALDLIVPIVLLIGQTISLYFSIKHLEDLNIF